MDLIRFREILYYVFFCDYEESTCDWAVINHSHKIGSGCPHVSIRTIVSTQSDGKNEKN